MSIISNGARVAAAAADNVAPTVRMFSDDVSRGGTQFMHGQTGDPAFAIKSWDSVVENAKNLPIGFDQKPAYIQLQGTSGPENVVHGVLHIQKGTVYREIGGGLFGIGKKTVAEEVIQGIDVRPMAEPRIPGPLDRIGKRLTQFKTDSKDLEKQAHEIGAQKNQYLTKADTHKATAGTRVDQAYTLLTQGDENGARTAVSQAVTETMHGRKWEQRAAALKDKETALRARVDDFNAGLADFGIEVDFLAADLQAAQVENRLMKNVSNLGEGADSLADDLAAVRSELDSLTGSTRAITEQIESGSVASTIFDPLKRTSEAAEREAATDAIMSQLMAKMANEQASGAVATTSKGQTIGASTAEQAADIAAAVLGKTS